MLTIIVIPEDGVLEDLSPEEGVLENLLPVPGESKFLSSWLGLRSAKRCLAGNMVTSSMLSRELGVSSVELRDEFKLDTDIKASGIRSL